MKTAIKIVLFPFVLTTILVNSLAEAVSEICLDIWELLSAWID